MSRYILIDKNSGYIFGDTATLARHTFAGEEFPVDRGALSPKEAARWLDEAEIGVFGRSYELKSRAASGDFGYDVYRADIGGSDAVPNIRDGQSQDEIDAVMQHCEYVGFVATT